MAHKGAFMIPIQYFVIAASGKLRNSLTLFWNHIDLIFRHPLLVKILLGNLKITAKDSNWSIMGEEYLKESFNGLGEKHSTAESSLTLLFDSGNLSTACENEKTPKHKASRDNADSAVVESSNAAKKKRASRINGGGLRQFSVMVCKKLESKGRTTYSEVADEIISELNGMRNDTTVSLDEFDEKNIRRRVYDALNVLMALEIITRDKKEIQWKGLPSTDIKELEELKAVRVKLVNMIRKKAAYLNDLEEQIAGLQCLISRNKQLLNCGNSPVEGFSLPFLLVQSPNVVLGNGSTPFSLHDDAYILKLLRRHQLPVIRPVSRSSSSALSSSSSGIVSRATKPFSWNSEKHAQR
ncbi:Transcription factor-like protein DPB [Morus notabilis]|uniref:Transcription factor-like protein DPB n=1 Tax=Morus notabilis TaxID=981085 RepID=W9SWI6_9ROSA|nr:Transcription factor-like protein DPB [Morus notabilis]